MNKERKEDPVRQPNEGEGNRAAARQYNEAQQRFVKSGKVDEKARAAEHELRNEQTRRELEHAEAVGRRHAAKEDPEVKRRY